ncbi:hypothetical protein XmelCFBP4644_10155 [Xanthomonas melonis]|uniref:Uncharacterized protein n=1 Tax=Xanthomonas melonis TaxID=56456 RepID=A0A2S7DGW4_9XANT|nr:hypothetical protein XmelCFBP4644_10155 [Xanthomonas melonis]
MHRRSAQAAPVGGVKPRARQHSHWFDRAGARAGQGSASRDGGARTGRLAYLRGCERCSSARPAKPQGGRAALNPRGALQRFFVDGRMHAIPRR